MTDEQKAPYKGEFIEPAQLSPEELKARGRRNIWLGLALFGFVILVGAISIIRISQGIGVSERM